MSFDHLFRLNVLTAGPVLRLLLAAEGREDPNVHEGWTVFRRFTELPSAVRDHGVTFQVSESEAGPDQFEVFFGRHLSQLTLGDYEDSRIIGLYYVVEPTEPMTEVELWSQDYPSVLAFLTAVEADRAFSSAMSAQMVSGSLWVEEVE